MLPPILSAFFAFLRHPCPMQAEGLDADGAIRRWLVLSATQIMVLALVVMPLILAWQHVFGLPSPNAFDGLGPLALWGGAVLLAPVLEELFFRGWMSGRPAALWLTAIALAALALFVALARGNPLAMVAILGGTLIVAALAWWRTRRDTRPPAWFAPAFPAMFHGVTALFALMHVFNYPALTLAVLPMVLPQLWSGLMLGYIRVRQGLLASILAHIASNAAMLTAALATG